VAIQGRKTELRQLLKLLNLAKTGQPKAALITGDAGIGKTALLETFIGLVREGVYCRILDLGRMQSETPEQFYVETIERLQQEAEAILDEALIAVNEITQELDLRWERQDLVRAIALVKLQESIGGKGAVSQEQLVKAIRSQVPTVKKLKLSVNDSIEKLVDLIVNPWVMVATSILNPMSQPLQDAIRVAASLKENNYQSFKGGSGISSAGILPSANPPEASTTPKRTPLPPIVDDAVREVTSEVLDASQSIVHMEAIPQFDPDQLQVPPVFQVPSTIPQPPVGYGYETPASMIRVEGPPKPIKDPLVSHLMNVFNFINSAIINIDSALLIVLDEWERIARASGKAELKEFISELLYQITEQKNYHMMAVLTARTEGESYTLGGQLYNHFRTKLLLEPLNENVCRKLLRSAMKEAGAEIDEEVNVRVYRLSQGNPYWHLKVLSYLRERVESNRLKHVDAAFFDKLAIESVDNLTELSFTRLKLAFLNDEESLYKVIAALLKTFGEESFSANQGIKEISASQGFTDGYVFEVLRALYRHDFIRRVEKPAPRPDNTDDTLAGEQRRPDPAYTIQSRYILDFLHEKTRTIETDISTDEKLTYLKKIIPLSIKSGELDREKTQEVLAISNAMGKPEIVEFLEDTFLEYLQDDKAVVRVTALNNMALIDSAKAREALFKAMRDEDSMVREYAARNLALISQKTGDATLAGRIVDLMIQAIDDESEAVRAQVYGTLAKYRWQRDLLNVFIKGMSDACDSVRLTSVKNLVDMETESPFAFNSFMDAMSDPMTEIRRYACLGLQRYTGHETIDALVKILQSDADSGIRALAADSLSRMEDPKAFRAMIHALRHEPSEDVKLAVVRALGKRRGWQTEEILLEALQSANPEEMPVFVWASVRSLGQVGGTERSVSFLAALKKRTHNSIITNAVAHASQKIQGRIDELRLLERQLEDATPLTVAIPTEYDQEVEVPEEEVPSISLLDEPILSAGEDDPDEDLKEQAEYLQLELNEPPRSSGITLPFERRPNK
jgi:HEAT repeat protein/Cdc6-like AAA superfamily ATPase